MVNRAELPRKLGLFDSTAIVVGTMVGSAIFLVPSSIAQSVPSVPMIMAVWIIAGLLSFIGALAYAELGAMLPATGGPYVFLRESFGPLFGFLCGWTFFLAARSGGIAVVAVGFSIYLSYFIPLSPLASKLTAVGLILTLTAVNYCGIRLGAVVQNIFTSLKILGILILIVSAFLSPAHQTPPLPAAAFSLSQFGVAMIAGLWAYNGWFAISLVAGEVRNPQRNLPLSLIIGVTAVLGIYLLANIGYLRLLPVPVLAVTERVASTVAERTVGSAGAALVALTILISTFGTTNGNIMTAPRLYFAQARDGLFFEKFGVVHPRFETPAFAIVGQGIWSSVLAVSGSYEVLFSYSTFAFWVFYGMTVAGVMILRRKYPDMPRPYKMWGYPVTPIVFVVVTVWFVANTLISKPATSVVGSLIILSGIPAYYGWRWQAQKRDGRQWLGDPRVPSDALFHFIRAVFPIGCPNWGAVARFPALTIGSGATTLSDTNTWLFNTNQLATWEQARDYANKLSAGPVVVGAGVKPETSNPATSGIYRPDWVGGPGGFAEPNHTDPLTGEKSFFLHYRFRNGAEGMNVGLIMDKFRRYPNSPAYVMGALAAEANSMAR